MAEGKALLPSMKEDAGPLTVMDIARIMYPVQMVYYQPGKSEQQWTLTWAVYRDVLRKISAIALQAAVDEYNALPDSKHFPMPGPLLSLSEKHQSRISRRWRNVEAALSLPPGADLDAASDAFSATFAETQP